MAIFINIYQCSNNGNFMFDSFNSRYIYGKYMHCICMLYVFINKNSIEKNQSLNGYIIILFHSIISEQKSAGCVKIFGNICVYKLCNVDAFIGLKIKELVIVS